MLKKLFCLCGLIKSGTYSLNTIQDGKAPEILYD